MGHCQCASAAKRVTCTYLPAIDLDICEARDAIFCDAHFCGLPQQIVGSLEEGCPNLPSCGRVQVGISNGNVNSTLKSLVATPDPIGRQYQEPLVGLELAEKGAYERIAVDVQLCALL